MNPSLLSWPGANKPPPGTPLIPGHRFARQGLSVFPFSEVAGTITSEASGSGQGVISQGAVWRPSKSGGGLTFNGTSGNVVFGSSIADYTQTLTVSARLYLPSGIADSEDFICGRDNAAATCQYKFSATHINNGVNWGPRLGINAGGSFHDIALSNGALIALGPLGGGWHTFAATYDGKSVTLYVDGCIVLVTPVSGVLNHLPSEKFCVGARGGGTSLFWRGGIESIVVAGTGFMPAEVASLYASPYQMFAFGPARFYSLPSGIISFAPGNRWYYQMIGNSNHV